MDINLTLSIAAVIISLCAAFYSQIELRTRLSHSLDTFRMWCKTPKPITPNMIIEPIAKLLLYLQVYCLFALSALSFYLLFATGQNPYIIVLTPSIPFILAIWMYNNMAKTKQATHE